MCARPLVRSITANIETCRDIGAGRLGTRPGSPLGSRFGFASCATACWNRRRSRFGLPRLFLAGYLILAVNVFVTVAPSRLIVIEAWSVFPLDFLGRRHPHVAAGPSASGEPAASRLLPTVAAQVTSSTLRSARTVSERATVITATNGLPAFALLA